MAHFEVGVTLIVESGDEFEAWKAVMDHFDRTVRLTESIIAYQVDDEAVELEQSEVAPLLE